VGRGSFVSPTGIDLAYFLVSTTLKTVFGILRGPYMTIAHSYSFIRD